MPRRPSQRELTAELLACVESDAEDDRELDRLLVVHGVSLADALGCSPSALGALRGMDGPERSRGVRSLLRAERERRQQLQSTASQNLALAAAAMLSKLAEWSEGGVRLDPRIVLGTGLLGDRSRRFIRFDAQALGTVTVRRDKLSEAAKALRFPDLTCWLNASRLQFGWRDGRGGLHLANQPVGVRDADAVLHVTLERRRPQVIEAARHVPVPAEPRWLADGFSDLSVF
jgi:hypothetical protein